MAIFTNAAGKFGADGLAPGRWTIEMATEGTPTSLTLDIPKGTSGLFKAGTLTAAGQPTGAAGATVEKSGAGTKISAFQMSRVKPK